MTHECKYTGPPWGPVYTGQGKPCECPTCRQRAENREWLRSVLNFANDHTNKESK